MRRDWARGFGARFLAATVGVLGVRVIVVPIVDMLKRDTLRFSDMAIKLFDAQ